MEGPLSPAAWQPSPHLLFFTLQGAWRCSRAGGLPHLFLDCWRVRVWGTVSPVCRVLGGLAWWLGIGEFWSQQNEDTRHTLPEIFLEPPTPYGWCSLKSFPIFALMGNVVFSSIFVVVCAERCLILRCLRVLKQALLHIALWAPPNFCGLKTLVINQSMQMWIGFGDVPVVSKFWTRGFLNPISSHSIQIRYPRHIFEMGKIYNATKARKPVQGGGFKHFF